jgi:hypothetical protein
MFKHSYEAVTVDPSGQTLPVAAAVVLQSADVVQVGGVGHSGKTHSHCPPTHAYESVTVDPSGQAIVSGRAVLLQSADVRQIALPPAAD